MYTHVSKVVGAHLFLYRNHYVDAWRETVMRQTTRSLWFAQSAFTLINEMVVSGANDFDHVGRSTPRKSIKNGQSITVEGIIAIKKKIPTGVTEKAPSAVRKPSRRFLKLFSASFFIIASLFDFHLIYFAPEIPLTLRETKRSSGVNYLLFELYILKITLFE